MKIKCYSVKEERILDIFQDALRRARANRVGLPADLAKCVENAQDRRDETLKAARAALPIEKIFDALEAVNGKATAHTYTTAEEIRLVAKMAESQLEASGVPLADRSGCEIIATSGDAVANRYRHKRNATRVTLKRGSGAWYITEIVGVDIYPAGPGKPQIRLSDKAREAVVRAALAPYA